MAMSYCTRTIRPETRQINYIALLIICLSKTRLVKLKNSWPLAIQMKQRPLVHIVFLCCQQPIKLIFACLNYKFGPTKSAKSPDLQIWEYIVNAANEIGPHQFLGYDTLTHLLLHFTNFQTFSEAPHPHPHQGNSTPSKPTWQADVSKHESKQAILRPQKRFEILALYKSVEAAEKKYRGPTYATVARFIPELNRSLPSSLHARSRRQTRISQLHKQKR